MVKLKCLIFAFLIFSTSGPAMAGDTITLVINGSVEVSGEDVFLGDISKITADRQSRKTLKALRLGKSPAFGNSKTVIKNRLEDYLSRRGWRNIEVKAPEKIRIWRKSYPLSGEEISSKVKKSIIESMPWPKDKAVIDVSTSKDVVKISDSNPDIKVEFPPNFKFLGNELVRVQILAGGVKIKTLWVKSNIRIYSEIVRSARPILRNEILNDKDLYIDKKLVSHIQKGVFNNTMEITGMRAKRVIKKGAVILDSDIMIPPIIRRGSILNILAQKGLLTVSTKGKALEKGFKGKMMKVENLSSRKVVLAEVVDSKTVKIIF